MILRIPTWSITCDEVTTMGLVLGTGKISYEAACLLQSSFSDAKLFASVCQSWSLMAEAVFSGRYCWILLPGSPCIDSSCGLYIDLGIAYVFPQSYSSTAGIKSGGHPTLLSKISTHHHRKASQTQFQPYQYYKYAFVQHNPSKPSDKLPIQPIRMSSYPKTIKATTLALLAATATAGTLPAHLQDLARGAIYARDPPTALPQAATDDQLRWQPGLDFDTDGCYNTPAIDASGNGTY